jgi:hypothetical protein
LLVSNGIHLEPSGSDAVTTVTAVVDARAKQDSADLVADVFCRLDTNRDDQVTFGEFCRGLVSDPVVTEAVMKPLREHWRAATTKMLVEASRRHLLGSLPLHHS